LYDEAEPEESIGAGPPAGEVRGARGFKEVIRLGGGLALAAVA